MTYKVHFANISITGKDKELLDYGDLVVRSVLKNQEPRKTSSATYHFMDVDIGFMKEGQKLSLSLYGRFVKHTVLSSEQELIDGKLVPKIVNLPTSPSSFFVFNLADHRVAFLEETKGAPSVRTFGNTLRLFIKKTYDQYTREMWDRAKEIDPSTTLASVRKAFPLPLVHTVPIAGKVEISAFIQNFAKITSLSIQVVKRNQDMTAGGIFDALSEDVSELGPASSTLRINGGKDGLIKQKTQEYLGEIADHGYEDSKVVGTDASGAKLAGTNSDYSLTRYIAEVPAENRSRAERVYEEYISAKTDGQIRVEARNVNEIGQTLDDLARKHG